MRLVQGEAGEGSMPTGVGRSTRGGQTWAWRHSALPVCSPHVGCGWYPSQVGWGPFTCLCLAKTPPWRPRVCLPKETGQSFPFWDPLVWQVALQGPRPGSRTGELRTPAGGSEGSGTWFSFVLFSLYWLPGSLTLFFCVSG